MVYHQDSRVNIWESFQKEIQTPQFLRKFNRFKKAHKQFEQFNTPKELVECFSGSNEILRPLTGSRMGQAQGDNEENQPNPFNPRLKDRLLHLLVSNYQNKPERKPWLMTLLLVISWKQMECTYSRFGYEALKLVNPHDLFAPVYESYIDAFLSLKQKTARKFAFHLKDRAEYLIKKELRECGRFKGESKKEIPASEYIPWNEQVDEMIWEWTSRRILNKKQSELIIYRTVYEFTFKELEKKFKRPANTLKLRFHRAVKKLKPYLKGKYFTENERFV